jgi:hypothetical protein
MAFKRQWMGQASLACLASLPPHRTPANGPSSKAKVWSKPVLVPREDLARSAQSLCAMAAGQGAGVQVGLLGGDALSLVWPYASL